MYPLSKEIRKKRLLTKGHMKRTSSDTCRMHGNSGAVKHVARVLRHVQVNVALFTPTQPAVLHKRVRKWRCEALSTRHRRSATMTGIGSSWTGAYTISVVSPKSIDPAVEIPHVCLNKSTRKSPQGPERIRLGTTGSSNSASSSTSRETERIVQERAEVNRSSGGKATRLQNRAARCAPNKFEADTTRACCHSCVTELVRAVRVSDTHECTNE